QMTTRRPPFDWEEAKKRDKIAKQGAEPAYAKAGLATVLNEKDRKAWLDEQRSRTTNTEPEHHEREVRSAIIYNEATGKWEHATSIGQPVTPSWSNELLRTRASG